MPGQLEHINVTDFTGGINMYRNEFQLADNESPDMLNVEIDPRAGFFVRQGMTRINGADIVTPASWDPRSAQTVILSGGGSASYISSGGKIWTSTNGEAWDDTGIACSASPHLADFVGWGDGTYIACGPLNESVYQEGNYVATTNEPTVLTAATSANYDDDYTVPTFGVMPRAEVIEAHAGYLFTANIWDDIETDGSIGTAAVRKNRIRWSHPLNPQAYATSDFLDIEAGGSEITALVSFRDRLMIFKTDSIWLLYGYETDSFQLFKMNEDVGVRQPGAVARSGSAVFFYSSSGKGDIWAYDGSPTPVQISEPLRPVMDGITAQDDVWLEWADRQLFVSLSWRQPVGLEIRSIFTWDPDVGRGAWYRTEPATGEPLCFLRHSHFLADGNVVIVMGGVTAAVCRANGASSAQDFILQGSSGEKFDTRYRTGWKFHSTPELPKSWLRPRMVVGRPNLTTTITVNVYRDYNGDRVERIHTLDVDGQDRGVWTLLGDADPIGFDWGDGTEWGDGNARNSQIDRFQPTVATLGNLGVCAAVQLEFIIESEFSTGARWGLDAIILKHRSRRATT